MSDPYLDPQSGILTNRFGLTDQESLDQAESNSVSVRSILLQLNPLKGDFDSEHLKAIHSYLFRDVYEWAGQFRTIPLAKAEDVRGGRIIRFTPPDSIEQELKRVFDELANEHFLEGLPRREFARKVAGLEGKRQANHILGRGEFVC
jgi:cell filamentation protein